MLRFLYGIALAFAVATPFAGSFSPRGVGLTDIGGQTTIETTDATQSTIVEALIPQDACGQIDVRVMAYRPSDGVSKSWLLEIGVKRFSTGDAVLLGPVVQVVTPHSDTAAALWAATVDVSGPNMRIRVTGDLTSTIEWGGAIHGQTVSIAP